MKERLDHSSPSTQPSERSLSKKVSAKPLGFRRKESSPERGHDLWLITLSDLLLLLMVFFVILFGMTFQREDSESHLLTAQITVPVKTEGNPVEVQPSIAPAVSPGSILSSLEADLTSILGDDGRQQEVIVTWDTRHLILTFPERIVFDPGQARLKPSAQPILDKVASFVLTHPTLIVEVQGHTDDRPIHSWRYPSNWELSVDRATQVAKALIGLGLDPTRLTVKGFGEYRALYPNDSDSSRLKNRRVEVQLSLSPQS